MATTLPGAASDEPDRSSGASLLERAIENNVALCTAVLAAHGVSVHSEASALWTDADVPPFYPNLITRVRGPSEALSDRIAAIGRAGLAPPWGLKDSFAAFDADALARLVGAPMRRLFDAQWYGMAPRVDRPRTEGESDLVFERVGDPTALADWEIAWQRTSPAPGQGLFPAALLADPSLAFFRMRRAGDRAAPDAGALLSLSPGTVGLSNVFPANPHAHRQVARLAARLHPDRAVVGYGVHADLESLGFADLGPLRVWLRDST